MLSLIKRVLGCGAMALLVAASGHAVSLDGLTVREARTVGEGIWNLRFSARYGVGSEPLSGTFESFSSRTALEVDVFRAPFELVYGVADNMDLGFSTAFEVDRAARSTSLLGTVFNSSGFQNIRIFYKWEILRNFSWSVNFAFGGDQTIAGGQDKVDAGFGLQYTVPAGRGAVNLNGGMLFKGGVAEINRGGITSVRQDYANVVSGGVAYVRPLSERLLGIAELAGNTSPFKDIQKTTSTGIVLLETNDLLSLNLGGRYTLRKSLWFQGGLSFGILKGSPDVLARAGINWVFGPL